MSKGNVYKQHSPMHKRTGKQLMKHSRKPVAQRRGKR
jgi:hypothetical protein